MAQKVPLMYLANDILQNSKRQGNEFVQEFWNVLPKAVKDIVSQGDDYGKSVVSRLVFLSIFLSFLIGAFLSLYDGQCLVSAQSHVLCLGSVVFDVRDEEI